MMDGGGNMQQKPEKIVIFGTGDIGRLAHYYFTYDSAHTVVAFSADRDQVRERQFQGLPVVPFEDVTRDYPPDTFAMFVALGYRDVNRVRAAKYREAKEKGYQLVSYMATHSVTWPDLSVGDNCFIFENQTIQPFARIGSNVTLWSGNHVGHDAVIGDHCFITSHVVISGHCQIGEYAFLGVNATIRDGVTVAPECVIGAGALIVKDTIAKGVYTGPAASLYAPDSAQLKYFTETNYSARQAPGDVA